MSNLLEQDIRIQIFIEIDSLGYISNIRKIRSNKELDKKLEKELTLNFQTDSIRFKICFAPPRS